MKYSIKFTLFLIFTLAFPFAIQAQNSDWIRVQSDNGEFSVELPKNSTYFYDKDGFTYSNWGSSDIQFTEMQMLNASDGKTVISVEIYKLNSPKNGLNTLLEGQDSKTSKLDNLPKNFTGKQTEKNTIRDYSNQKDVEISYVSRFFASKTHLYIVTAANRGAKTPAFEKFLSSIRLDENQTDNTKISSLKALLLADIGVDATDQPSQKPLPKTDKPKTPPTNPTPLLVLAKPRASYTEAARRKFTDGVIRLRLTFEKDGRISKIAIISSLQNGLNRTAFFAALRIKFIPSEKESVLETVSRPVEYSFSVR
jgi:TonB family protein